MSLAIKAGQPEEGRNLSPASGGLCNQKSGHQELAISEIFAIMVAEFAFSNRSPSIFTTGEAFDFFGAQTELAVFTSISKFWYRSVSISRVFRLSMESMISIAPIMTHSVQTHTSNLTFFILEKSPFCRPASRGLSPRPDDARHCC